MPELTIYECGICSCYHRWSWNGDCREDKNRYNSPEEYAAQAGLRASDIEVMSWEDRVRADDVD